MARYESSAGRGKPAIGRAVGPLSRGGSARPRRGGAAGRLAGCNRADGAFSRGVRVLSPDDLPPGELTIRVEWSSVNFKDGLAARADGKVARVYPLVAGIDLAVEVVR